mmetsp:Transcript_9513/g.34627  ORF Transcript_9513/g.34627 Transcript_9513/m.34627 type:complete len:299 (-) Transcript_9513:1050-1946(-)
MFHNLHGPAAPGVVLADRVRHHARLREVVLPRPAVNPHARASLARRPRHGSRQRRLVPSHPRRGPPGAYRRGHEVHLRAERDRGVRDVGEEQRRARAHAVPEVYHARVFPRDARERVAPLALGVASEPGRVDAAAVPRPRRVRDIQNVESGVRVRDRGGGFRARAADVVLPARREIRLQFFQEPAPVGHSGRGPERDDEHGRESILAPPHALPVTPPLPFSGSRINHLGDDHVRVIARDAAAVRPRLTRPHPRRGDRVDVHAESRRPVLPPSAGGLHRLDQLLERFAVEPAALRPHLL